MEMRRLNELFFWEIRYRLDKITEFRELVISYFSAVEHSDFSYELYDTEETSKIRSDINLKTAEVSTLVAQVENPNITHYPAPAVGGYVTNINLIDNIFYLHRFQITPQSLIDVLEKAIGIYNKELSVSLIRTINPFLWLGRILEIITSIPFQILGSLGFNRVKIENSGLGKFVKYLLKLTAFIMGLWEILYRIGVLPDQISITRVFDKLF